jgi:hypothetical protein
VDQQQIIALIKLCEERREKYPEGTESDKIDKYIKELKGRLK